MVIDQYAFGHICIDGCDYDRDVIIFPDHVQDGWRRRSGHRLDKDDLATVLAERPEVLVIGSGYYGRMEVPVKTLEILRGQGIRVRVAPTGKAVAEFNRLQGEYARIVAALHLTC